MKINTKFLKITGLFYLLVFLVMLGFGSLLVQQISVGFLVAACVLLTLGAAIEKV